MFFIYHFKARLAEIMSALLSLVEKRKKRGGSEEGRTEGPGEPVPAPAGAEAGFRAAADRLDGLADALETACGNVEPRFIELGRRLESAYADAERLAREIFGTLTRIGGEENQGGLLRVGHFAKEALGLFGSRHEQATANLNGIGTLIRHLGELMGMCAELRKIALTLRVVGFNMGVESVRTKTSSEMFGVVARQICRLSDNIVAISENMVADVGKTRTELASAYEKASRSMGQVDELGEDARHAVRDSVREIERIMARSFEGLEQAGTHSREISLQVGEVVAGIQIHDSMSQRISHISKALRHLGDSRAASSGSPEAAADAERLAAAHAIVEIQIAQLGRTISDIDDVRDKTRRAFENIGAEIGLLIQSFPAFGSRDGTGEPTPEFNALRTALSHLGGLLGEGSRMVDRIQETAARASETGDRLGAYVEDMARIGFETHLVALNAIVKAAHLGEEGLSLEVLAQEAKILSDRSKLFTGQVAEGLGTISGLARKIRGGLTHDGHVPASGSVPERDPLPCTQKERDLAESIKMNDISTLYARFRSESSDAFRNAEALKTLIARMISGLDFFPELSRELEGHLGELAAVRDMLASGMGGVPPIRDSETEKLTESYTMRQEWGVHEQVTGRPFGPEDQDGEASDAHESRERADPDDDGDEDLGDNVELF